MTIANRFSILLAEKGHRERRRIPLSEISRITGVMEKTLYAWSANKVTRFDAHVIEALCNYLECKPADLIELE